MATICPDTSHYQVQLTPARARQAARRVDAFLFKSTEGTGFIDPDFSRNVAAARKTRNPVGAYHYVDGASGAAQAAFFLRVAGHVDFLVVDWESGSRDIAVEIIRTAKQKFGGPVIEYRGAWARAHGGDITQADAAMVPDYGPASLPSEYKPQHLPLAAWQYTDGKYNGTKLPDHIPGIGACDVSTVFIPRYFGIGKAKHAAHSVTKYAVKGKDRTFKSAAAALKVAKKVLHKKGTTTITKKKK